MSIGWPIYNGRREAGNISNEIEQKELPSKKVRERKREEGIPRNNVRD